MPTPLFEFFETIAEELSSEESRVITREDLQVKDEESLLLDELKREMKATSTEEAIQRAVDVLRQHFEAKGSSLPFEYDPETGRFTAIDHDYLEFVKDMSNIRSINTKSRDFECGVATRLSQRATGSIHRVGHPRDLKRRSADFNAHLKTLGFSRPVLLGRDKDGGFDILWLLPVGTIPHRPVVSVQCKNGKFNMEVADQSVGAGSRSFSQHSGLQPSVHVPCVLFNDYIYPEILTRKQLNFVPLGLTDLAPVRQRISVELI
jgi:predicted Holliday junction resolvase-like endonuclease